MQLLLRQRRGLRALPLHNRDACSFVCQNSVRRVLSCDGRVACRRHPAAPKDIRERRRHSTLDPGDLSVGTADHRSSPGRRLVPEGAARFVRHEASSARSLGGRSRDRVHGQRVRSDADTCASRTLAGVQLRRRGWRRWQHALLRHEACILTPSPTSRCASPAARTCRRSRCGSPRACIPWRAGAHTCAGGAHPAPCRPRCTF